MISVKSKGDFDKTTNFLKRAQAVNPAQILSRYGEIGLQALMNATPRNTGRTAESWYYHVEKTDGGYALNFYNSNIQNGIRIAVILDLGHGTSNGGYVQGRDYINPAIQPIFDKIANEAWREVTDA